MSIILKALKKVQYQKEERASDVSPVKTGESGETGRQALLRSRSKASKGAKSSADVPATPPGLLSTQYSSGTRVASRTAAVPHRFGVVPKALLALMAAVGIFTTIWFLSTISSNVGQVTETRKAESHMAAEQPRRLTSPAPVVSPQGEPADSAGPQAPASSADETTLSTPGAGAAPASSPQIVSAAVAPPPQPKPAEATEKPLSGLASKAEAETPKAAKRVEKEAVLTEQGRPELKINAIAWRAAEPKAIVNMQRVYEGDEVDGATVLAINRKSIVFAYGGEIFEIRF